MNEPVMLMLAGGAGVLLGAVFFGGLWWTVRKGVTSPHPALWFIGSMLVRVAIVVGGFYFVSGGHWQRLVACLIGFMLARLIVTRLARPQSETNPPTAKEARHAP